VGDPFASREEFRAVMDRVFAMMDEDPEMGPALQAADVPQRFEFDDVDLVVVIRAARAGEPGHLHWTWDEDAADWEPQVRMVMSAETANRYFQGAENVPVALARRRIRASGDIRAALQLMPVTKAVFPRYRAFLEQEHPHLVV
jgi:hypothetical protein